VNFILVEFVGPRQKDQGQDQGHFLSAYSMSRLPTPTGYDDRTSLIQARASAPEWATKGRQLPLSNGGENCFRSVGKKMPQFWYSAPHAHSSGRIQVYHWKRMEKKTEQSYSSLI
jgi:hypothetical protein